MLCGTRQQHHKRIAQVLEARFPEVCETRPELLAHPYTEADLVALAIPYWERADQRAIERPAYVEGIAQLMNSRKGPCSHDLSKRLQRLCGTWRKRWE